MLKTHYSSLVVQCITMFLKQNLYLFILKIIILKFHITMGKMRIAAIAIAITPATDDIHDDFTANYWAIYDAFTTFFSAISAIFCALPPPTRCAATPTPVPDARHWARTNTKS